MFEHARRAARAVAAVALLGLCGAPPARARPVPIGRTVQVPFGLPDADPCAAPACDAHRSGRVAAVATRTGTPTRVSRAIVDGLTLQPGRAPALLAGGVVVLTTPHGFTALRSGVDGPPVWTLQLESGGDSVTRVPSGELLLTTLAGELLVADAATGTPRVRARVPGGRLTGGSPLVLPDGTLVVTRGDGGLETRAADTLAVGAELPVDVVTGSPVLLADGGVAVPASHSVLVLDPAGVRVRARWDLGTLGIYALSVARDGTVWASTVGGEAVGLDPRSGELRARSLGGDARMDGHGLALDADGGLRASVVPRQIPPSQGGPPPGPTAVVVATAPSGRILWRRNLEGAMSGLVVDEEGTTIVATAWLASRMVAPGTTPVRGAVWALDVHGEILWRAELPDMPAGPPLVARDGSVVVLGTPSGRIALSLSTYRGT